MRFCKRSCKPIFFRDNIEVSIFVSAFVFLCAGRATHPARQNDCTDRAGYMSHLTEHSLHVRLAQLSLPHPLTDMVYKAVAADNVDARHEDLVDLWETTIKIAACACWAVCRADDLRSDGLIRQSRQMVSPSAGRWCGLLREGLRVVRKALQCEGKHVSAAPAAVEALRPLIEGLTKSWRAYEGVSALVERMRTIDGVAGQLKGKKSLGDVIQAFPAYRRLTQAHTARNSERRRRNVEALLEALLDLLDDSGAPILGRYSLVVVKRLFREDERLKATLARLSGPSPLPFVRSLSNAAWGRLRNGRPYLYAEPELFVALYPAAAVERSADGWRLGWFHKQVRRPKLSFRAERGRIFRVKLDLGDYVSFLGVDRAHRDTIEALPEALQRLEPWRGLLAYSEDHAPLYFGREDEIEEVTAKLRKHGALLICGASGSGKSSLMNAGILPQLRKEAEKKGLAFTVLSLHPGTHPLQALRSVLLTATGDSAAEAAKWSQTVFGALPVAVPSTRPEALTHLLRGLAAHGRKVVICVDQLEETATLCDDSGVRNAFLDVLTHAAQNAREIPCQMVFTVRPDLLGRLLAHTGFRQLMNSRRFYALGHLEPENFECIIKGPLRGRETSLEPGLCETIINDVVAQPGSLALLSHMLSTLWRQRGNYGNRLTKEGYEAAGRLKGALSNGAQAALAELRENAAKKGKHATAAVEKTGNAKSSAAASLDSGDVEAALMRVFLQLVRVSEEGTFCRRRVPLGELAEVAGLTRDATRLLLVPFVSRRLVVLSTERFREGTDPADRLAAVRTASNAGKKIEISGSDVADVAGAADAAVAEEKVEVAHEELLVAWTYLRDRLQEENEVLVLRQAISRATQDWEASKRRHELWTDATTKLARSEELIAVGRLRLPKPETDFIRASRRAVRSRRRLFGTIAATTVAALVALSLVLAAAWRRAEKAHRQVVEARQGERRESEKATSRALISEYRRLRAAGKSAQAFALLRAAARPKAGRDGAEQAMSAGIYPLAHSPLVKILKGHKDYVHDTEYFPTGRHIATASADGTARIWDVATGRLVHSLEGHKGPVWAADSSPDGIRFATASADHTARIWDVATGRLIHSLEGHAASVLSVVFSPDGKTLATASADHTARIWEVATGRLLHDLKGHDKSVLSVIFSPDGKTLASASVDGTARIWNGVTGEVVHVLRGHKDTVEDIAYSPDGHHLATASGDATARIWESASGRLLHTLDHQRTSVTAVMFSPFGGDRLFTVSAGDRAEIWDVGSGKKRDILVTSKNRDLNAGVLSPLGRYFVTAGEHNTIVWDGNSGRLMYLLEEKTEDLGAGILRGEKARLRTVAFSPDGRRFVVSSNDYTARIYDIPSPPVVTLSGSSTAGAFSPDGKRFVTASTDRAARIWNAVTGEVLHVLRAGFATVTSVVFSPDGQHIATATDFPDATVRIWKARSAGLMCTCHETARSVRSVRFSPDGSRLAAVVSDNTVTIWDAGACRLLHSLEGHSARIENMVFSPEGHHLATASRDGTARIWNGVTGEVVHVLRGHKSDVADIAYSPDGHHLATASWDGTARIWKSASGKAVFILEEDSAVRKVAYGPRGRFLATAGHEVRIWDPASGRLLHSLEEEEGHVKNMVFSPEGRRLATVNLAERTCVWDVASGSLLRVVGDEVSGSFQVNFPRGVALPGPPKVAAVMFSPDGRHLATVSSTRSTHIWNVKTRSMRELVRWTGRRTNLRVCPATFEVVFVLPFPPPETVWAPSNTCDGGDHDDRGDVGDVFDNAEAVFQGR
jgi:WD40 repeat protein/energy-coupling factor transporter ATP-binding protein EcfA2